VGVAHLPARVRPLAGARPAGAPLASSTGCAWATPSRQFQGVHRVGRRDAPWHPPFSPGSAWCSEEGGAACRLRACCAGAPHLPCVPIHPCLGRAAIRPPEMMTTARAHPPKHFPHCLRHPPLLLNRVSCSTTACGRPCWRRCAACWWAWRSPSLQSTPTRACSASRPPRDPRALGSGQSRSKAERSAAPE